MKIGARGISDNPAHKLKVLPAPECPGIIPGWQDMRKEAFCNSPLGVAADLVHKSGPWDVSCANRLAWLNGRVMKPSAGTGMAQ